MEPITIAAIISGAAALGGGGIQFFGAKKAADTQLEATMAMAETQEEAMRIQAILGQQLTAEATRKAVIVGMVVFIVMFFGALTFITIKKK